MFSDTRVSETGRGRSRNPPYPPAIPCPSCAPVCPGWQTPAVHVQTPRGPATVHETKRMAMAGYSALNRGRDNMTTRIGQR